MTMVCGFVFGDTQEWSERKWTVKVEPKLRHGDPKMPKTKQKTLETMWRVNVKMARNGRAR